MKKSLLVAAAAAFLSVPAMAHNHCGYHHPTAFQLAYKGYQGAYSEALLTNGNRLGSAGIFCENVFRNADDVAATLVWTILPEDHVVVDSSDFIRDVADQAWALCED